MDNNASAPVIGVVLSVGIIVATSAGTFVLMGDLIDVETETEYHVIRLVPSAERDRLMLDFTAGQHLAEERVRLIVTINGVVTETTPGELGFAEEGGFYHVGSNDCLVGPGCPFSGGGEVDVKLIVGNTFVSNPKGYLSFFGILPSGAIQINCPGPVSMEVLGVDITQGLNGPPIPVFVEYTSDGGSSVTPLFGGQASAGMIHNDDAEAGDLLGIVAIAEKDSYYRSWQSFDYDPHVEVLGDGAVPPDMVPFGNQTALADYLAPYIVDGLISLAANEAIILVEFATDLNSPAADFQDLVVLFTFPPGGCLV